MKNLIYMGLVVALFSQVSCGGNANENEVVDNDTTTVDTTLVDSSLMDTIQSEFVDSAGYVDQEAEIADEIEKKFGEQWDFCDCVVKNDSVNKAIDLAESDEEFDKILARMDEIDSHCKEMLTTPNTTPEERKKHERKVKKCLKNAQ